MSSPKYQGRPIASGYRLFGRKIAHEARSSPHPHYANRSESPAPRRTRVVWPIAPVTGTHGVYLKFVAPKGKEYGPVSTGDLMYLNWFTFRW